MNSAAVLEQPDLFRASFAAQVGLWREPAAPERATHMHSVEAHSESEEVLGERARQVYAWLLDYGPATDRQVRDALFGEAADMNMVRPRISDLITKGRVHEVGETEDHVTGRRVRIVRARMPGELA
jgi:hypothetical protein